VKELNDRNEKEIRRLGDLIVQFEIRETERNGLRLEIEELLEDKKRMSIDHKSLVAKKNQEIEILNE
jgi:hypothetical protein